MIRIGTTANHVTPVAVEDDWRQWAVCREAEPELFFATSGPAVDDAKAICAGCPVRQACTDWAFAVPEEHGIFGGLTERERRIVLRARGALQQHGGRPPAPCGTRKAWERHIRNGEPIDDKCATQGRYTKPLNGGGETPAEVAA